MTKPITALRDAYAGQACYIVGKGPSLLRVTAADFGPGPVVTLNQALRKVESLGLPNPVLSMQKDGGYPIVCERPCADCTVVGPGDMIEPSTGAALLVSQANSEHCFAGYRPRYLFDTERDFGLRWTCPSAIVAVRLAELLGCDALVFVGMDACTTGDVRLVRDGISGAVDVPDQAHSYRDTALRLEGLLGISRIRDVRWLTP